MLSKFIRPGDRVELQRVDRMGEAKPTEDKKMYTSEIYDILTEDQLAITMPMEKMKLILLPIDEEYDLIFYTSNGLLQCFARVMDRYKNNNIYLMSVELTSNLRKYQRREYYRFSCALEMCSRVLTEEERIAIKEKKDYIWSGEQPLKRSVIVDISGGGLRFMSIHRYEPETLLYCNYHLLIQGEYKKYDLVGKVLSVRESENRPGTYEHRVKFINMDADTREEIIKYIFEEERKNRKREKER